MITAWLIAHWVVKQPLQSSLLRRSYVEVCNLVDQNFYKESPELKSWVSECYKRAFQYPLDVNVENWLLSVRRYLEDMEVSHLDIWDPDSSKSTFLGQTKETGIRVRAINGRYFITQLVENGPGDRAELKIGDEVLRINNEIPFSKDAVKFAAGHYLLLRKGIKISAQIEPEVLTVDLRPQVQWDDEGYALLQIPSFTRHYLEKEAWLEIVEDIKSAKGIVLDLRGNPGGDFVAMLRVLSTFRCDLDLYGKLLKKRTDIKESVTDFPESDPDHEVELVQNSTVVLLKRFSEYPCLNMPVVVLIDQGSTSTSEVMAQMMIGRKASYVVGDFTDGAVVTASFFELPLGGLYRITIPIAMYVTPKGDELENVGVRPQIILKYRLEDAVAGEDSWVNAALKLIKLAN